MSPRRARRREDEARPIRDDLVPLTESAADGEWVVRTVTGAGATKVYRCPGCDQEIGIGLAHLVAWRVGEEGDRRHWHRPCWQARLRRRTRLERSRNAPRHG